MPRAHNAGPKAFRAFAVGSNGDRKEIATDLIVIDMGVGEIEIGLSVALPTLAGQLPIRVVGEGLLLIGHADASSICVGIEYFGEGRLKST